MKLFGFTRTNSLLLALMLVLSLANGETPSCIDYAKGEFGPANITDDSICEDACQTAEGLPVGRMSAEKCTCLLIDNSGAATETRDLCLDLTMVESGAASFFTVVRLVLGTSLFVALAFV